MRTRALGTPAPGPGSADGSGKRELREPEGEHRAVRQSHPSTATRAPDGPEETYLRCACPPGRRGPGPGAGARRRDPSSSGAACVAAGLTAVRARPSRLPPGTASPPWQAPSLWMQEGPLRGCTRPAGPPPRPQPGRPPPTQVVEVIFNATPGVLLDEGLHEAPGLLPVADLRGHPGVAGDRGRGSGSDSDHSKGVLPPQFRRGSLVTHRPNQHTLTSLPDLATPRAPRSGGCTWPGFFRLAAVPQLHPGSKRQLSPPQTELIFPQTCPSPPSPSWWMVALGPLAQAKALGAFCYLSPREGTLQERGQATAHRSRALLRARPRMQ